MVTLLLVRHGEAEGNREDRFIGQMDVPLTSEGHRQADALAHRLEHIPLDAVVSSDLRRCIDTVAPAAASRGLEVETDPRLREIANGAWGGMLGTEIEAGWPDLFHRYRAGEDVHRPGGERWADVTARVVEVLQALGSGSRSTVLVGTHAGPIAAAARWAAGLVAVGNVFRSGFGRVANTSITTLQFPGPHLAGYNDLGTLDAPDAAGWDPPGTLGADRRER